MEPDVSQLIAGPGLLYVAPLGTTLPTLTGSTAVFPTGWRSVGFTDAGIDATYTPTVKPIYVDEQAAPVLDILEKEDFKIVAHLAEMNLKNLNASIAASVLTTPTQLSVGSKPLVYFMVACTGPAPDTFTQRVILVQKAIATGPVATKITRKDKQITALQFDARQLSGVNLYDIYDLGSGYEGS
jgi:hypothetical protein